MAEVGTTLSHYRLVEKIGEGGMGVVFKALDTKLHRYVALKLLRPELTADTGRRARFLQEARAAAAVSHPNIAVVHEIDEDGGVIFIVMELVEGKRLSELISGRPLAVDEALDIASQVADGLARAHQSRIVHRDLKPDNVIVGTDGRARILDFGLARILEEAERPALVDRSREEAITEDLSLAGRLLGTAAYMSPEQARGDAADARSDVFSFGVTLYEMLGGRRPFGGSTLAATLAKILEAEPEPLNSLRADLPGELGLIVHRCLRKPIADRFGDASELALALKRLRDTPGALRSAPVAPSATTIAVFPFSVRGGHEYGYLREGMVDLLSTKLDGAGELRSVDPHVILGCAAAQAVSAGDPSQAVAIAHRCGAGRFVLGNVLEAGGQLHIDASLYRASKELKLEAKVAVRGEASRIFEMVDQLTSELLASRPGGPGARLTRIAGMTTSSFPALKAYLEGEAEMRATRRVPAAEAYRRAVAADPAFALAWYRLSVAALWSGQSALADEAAQRAVEHGSRLSDRDRHLLEAFEASLRGANDDAERRYRTILGAHPDDVEAWYQLGELQFHCGPQRGHPIEHSREVWERVLSLDPRHASALMHLTVIEGSAGNRERLESLVRHVLDLYPSGDAGVWGRAYWSFLQDDPGLQEDVVEELRVSSDYVVTYAAWFVGAYLGHHAGAIRIGGLLTEPVRSPQVRAHGHVMRAHLELARGRWRAAQEELAAARPVSPASASECRALLTLSHLGEPAPVDLDRAWEEIAGLDPERMPTSERTSSWLAPHEGLHAHLRLYLLGLLDVRRGRIEEARGYARQLAGLQPSHLGESLAHDMALSIRAQSARKAGRHAEALATLEAARMQARFDLMLWSPFHSRALERYVRAELLAELGRHREAISWYGTFEETSIYDRVYVAPSRMKRGELCELLGEAQAAAAHYRRFIELWSECDPELRPTVSAARERLAALGG